MMAYSDQDKKTKYSGYSVGKDSHNNGHTSRCHSAWMHTIICISIHNCPQIEMQMDAHIIVQMS